MKPKNKRIGKHERKVSEARLKSQGHAKTARGARTKDPYAVIAWCQSGESIQVLETAMYWGRVDAKWNTQASTAELAALAEAAKTEFRCSEGPLLSSMYGTGFVSWQNGRQVACEAGLFAEEGSVFWPRLKEVLDRAEETYNLFGDAPPN